jgi:hypothetical protein
VLWEGKRASKQENSLIDYACHSNRNFSSEVLPLGPPILIYKATKPAKVTLLQHRSPRIGGKLFVYSGKQVFPCQPCEEHSNQYYPQNILDIIDTKDLDMCSAPNRKSTDYTDYYRQRFEKSAHRPPSAAEDSF